MAEDEEGSDRRGDPEQAESQADVVLEDLAEVYGSLRKATIRARARGDLA